MQDELTCVLNGHHPSTSHALSLFPLQPRDLWSAGRREKEGKERAPAAEEGEEEDMERGGAEEDDDGGEEDPAVAMSARMERRAARRARRASAPTLTTSTPSTTFKPAPSQWSVEEVTAFIHTLPGNSSTNHECHTQDINKLLTRPGRRSASLELAASLKIVSLIYINKQVS